MNLEKHAIIHSSHGDIEINKNGIPCQNQEWVCEIAFDLKEYAKTYPDNPYPDEYDILDLGAWYYGENGELKYMNPDSYFRKQIGK